ncbi:alpha/beta hydrolase [Roseibium sp.]|uniref:alpha/beta hydrolase n=1 Tax=Roseibium sp. TaxID=1936156 RepID=UPI003D09A546
MSDLSGISRQIAFLLAVLLLVSACAGPPDNIIGLDSPSSSLSRLQGLKSREVYILTTRAASDDPALLFSGDRGEGLSLAKVRVTIPPGHKTGHIERAKSLPPDPRKDFTIVDPEVFATDNAFVADLRRKIRSQPKSGRDVLLFVHGFNTTLTDAIVRTAQFANDMNFSGVPVVFSWASKGKVLDYVYDLNSTLTARDRLVDGANLLDKASPTGFDLVAHSMGNFLTMEAIRQAAMQKRYNTTGKIRTVILASPDIDIDVFETQIRQLPRSQRKFYVLISHNDKALSFSRKIAGGVNRVGEADAERLAKLGVTVVDLTQIKDTNSLNHTKFADAPEVVQLIGFRLAEGNSLETRNENPGVVRNIARSIANITVSAVGDGQLIVAP